MTTAAEFYVGSRDRSFRINEYLMVEDKYQGDIVCEVMESNTYNRYIPLNISGDLTDDDVLESLSQIGYQVSDETIYIGKCRLLNEAQYPIETGSSVREPKFKEIEHLLINSTMESGLLLGSIKYTDKLHDDMGKDLKDLYHLYDDKLESQKDVPFFFNLYEMVQYPHIGVFGGSGSGKSYGIRVIIEELMQKGIPTVIFDPHYEMEFQIDKENPSAKREYVDKYNIFNLGKDTGVRFKDLTPGELKKLLNSISELTEAMESTIDLLCGHFNTMPDVFTFKTFVEDLIEMKSMTDSQLEGERENTGGELQKKYERLLQYHIRYGHRINDSTIRAIGWRLRSLEYSGIFNYDSRELIDNLKLGKTCVVRGTRSLLLVYGSYLMNTMYYARRNYIDLEEAYFPPFVVITDEAHDFAPKGDIKAPSRTVFREIAQEGRKYGVFLVLATQRPTLLDETVTAQLNSKFIFRTVRGTDIQTIREETDISSEEAKRLPYLKTGDMFASVASVGRTIFSRVRAAETKKPNTKNPFDELKVNRQEEIDRFFNSIEAHLPISEGNMVAVVKQLEKEGFRLTVEELIVRLDQLVGENRLKKEENIIAGNIYSIII